MRFLIAVALFLLGPAAGYASAQTMPAVRVISESQYEVLSNCQLSYADAVAALQAGLRYNNIPVEYGAASDQSLSLYVNLTALTHSAGACVVNVEVRLYEAAPIQSQASGQRHFVRGMYCIRGSMLRGPSVGLQARVTNELEGFLNLCIADYQKSVVK